MIGNTLFALLLIGNIKAPSTDTSIRWSDTTRLSYTDFTGTQDPPKDSGERTAVLAFTYADIDYRIDLSAGKHRIHAHGVMRPEHSWMTVRTPEALKHEQGHFDIAEIYARRFEKKINDTTINDIHDFIVFVTDSFKDCMDELNAEQYKYDRWSMNTPGQHYYYKWIHNQLYPSNNPDSLMAPPF